VDAIVFPSFRVIPFYAEPGAGFLCYWTDVAYRAELVLEAETLAEMMF